MFRAIVLAFLAFILLNVLRNNVYGSHPGVMLPLTAELQKERSSGELNHCTCIEYNCGCCAHLVEKLIRLDSTICANATYLKRDYGFSMTVTFNKFIVFNETMSLRNPPPVCMEAPFVEELAEVCVRMHDIQATSAHLHACVEVDAMLKRFRIAKYELGCFDMEDSALRKALEQLENEVL